MTQVRFKNFSKDENAIWRSLFQRQAERREQQLVPQFSQGLEQLAITAERIPDLQEVNSRLMLLSGWQGVPVEGLEEGRSFYALLAEKKFPIGNFIRDPKDLSYTPAPDIFHDLYGHLPFFADPAYGDFCYQYGLQASRFLDSPKILREFERFFWFTIEFALLQTENGLRIFGAGLASSFGECEYALSGKPNLIRFARDSYSVVEQIRSREFNIDTFQETLFVLQSAEQLYESLDLFVAPYS